MAASAVLFLPVGELKELYYYFYSSNTYNLKIGIFEIKQSNYTT
jgi:hypothetical protein